MLCTLGHCLETLGRTRTHNLEYRYWFKRVACGISIWSFVSDTFPPDNIPASARYYHPQSCTLLYKQCVCIASYWYYKWTTKKSNTVTVTWNPLFPITNLTISWGIFQEYSITLESSLAHASTWARLKYHWSELSIWIKIDWSLLLVCVTTLIITGVKWLCLPTTNHTCVNAGSHSRLGMTSSSLWHSADRYVSSGNMWCNFERWFTISIVVLSDWSRSLTTRG